MGCSLIVVAFRCDFEASSVSFLGITKLRFKPAYNPYTEPSMEVFSYHEGIVEKLLQQLSTTVDEGKVLQPFLSVTVCQ